MHQQIRICIRVRQILIHKICIRQKRISASFVTCLPTMMSRAGTTSSTPRLVVASLMSTSWHYQLDTKDQLDAKACRGQLDVYQLALPARRQGLPWPARCLPAGTTSSTPRLVVASSMSTSGYYQLDTKDQLDAKACRGQLDVYQLALSAPRQGLPWPA